MRSDKTVSDFSVMSFRIAPPTSLVFLLLINGGVAQSGWGVDYSPKSICALKGSTVTMGCTYTYPWSHSVQRDFWTKQWPVNGTEPPDLLNDPEYRDRVQFTGDKQHNSTLRLRDVTEKDQSKYYFRFITDQTGGKWQGLNGVDLSVTVLQVEVPETVTEGDNVTLTCKTSCSLTDSPTFTWYKNGHGLSSRTDQLHLQSVSREDKGRYHCAVQGLKSPEVTLNVRYGPQSVSVSIRPSGEIVKGSSVTLTCSSDANPPVQNYTWFKEGETSPVGSGWNYSFILNSCGWYYCFTQNELGSKNSSAVYLTFKGLSMVVIYIIAGAVAVCLGIFLIIAIVCIIRRKRRNRSSEEPKSNQENLCSCVATNATIHNPTTESLNQENILYATVDQCGLNNKRSKQSPVISSSGPEGETEYGNIQHCRSKVKTTEGDDVHYASIRFAPAAPAHSSVDIKDPSVIYSSVS
ncbi:B-cell receptor CD22-like [Hoplias malabaricus]|uniref:B-cell receptor CD22-like n=1 Tax=Hoplias malabaricus TaxID=27720 RepID=UPI003462C14D